MKSIRLITAAALLIGLSACDSDNDGFIAVTPPPPPPVGTAKLQILHASPDAPPVNIIANGAALLSDVPYKAGTAKLDITEGTLTVQIDADTPSGTVTVLPATDLTIAADKVYTVVAAGSVEAGATNPFEALVFETDDVAPAAGNARLAVLHGAPNAPTVDVYLTAVGADLSATAPTVTLAFGESLDQTEVPAAEYQIRITLPGQTTPLFDSGAVTLEDGNDLFVAAVDSTGATAAGGPVSLVLLTGEAAPELLDKDTPTQLRVIHASPDAPAVDVLVNDTIELVEDLEYQDSFGPASVTPATYNVKVTVANNPGAVAIDAGDIQFDAGVAYDVLAIGTIGNMDITALLATDDYQRLATSAKVRIIHASPTAQNVDIYVTAAGADINNETPFLSDVPFSANTGFVAVAAGTYDVTVVPAGTKTAAIGPATITIDNGGLYTAVAIDATGGGTPLGLILLDDFILP